MAVTQGGFQVKVRTTIQPGHELDVSEAEYLDLKRQGLILPSSEGREPARTPKSKPADSKEN